MTKRFISGFVAGLLLFTALGTSLSAQGPYSAQIEQFWQSIRNGGRAFTILATTAGGYHNFGTTLGTNGYGIRDNGGTIQFKDSGGSWASIVGAITGGTCTNQAVTAIAAATGAPTCTTLTSAYVDSSIAKVGSANLFTALQTVTLTALGTTSTDGLLLQNTTAATMGTTAQISPRNKWCGTAYNSVSTLSETDCWISEVLPSTSAGATSSQIIFSRSTAGGAFAAVFSISSGGGFSLGLNNGFIAGNGVSVLKFPTTNGLFNVQDNAADVGAQFNVGSAVPTVTSCGTGAVTSHSTNTAGEVTATGATSCTLTFGAPNFTNQPFCTLEDESTLATTRISVISVSAFTVTGLTSGDKFMYTCIGGI